MAQYGPIACKFDDDFNFDFDFFRFRMRFFFFFSGATCLSLGQKVMSDGSHHRNEEASFFPKLALLTFIPHVTETMGTSQENRLTSPTRAIMVQRNSTLEKGK